MSISDQRVNLISFLSPVILDQKDLITSNYVKSERDCELLIWRQFYKNEEHKSLKWFYLQIC